MTNNFTDSFDIVKWIRFAQNDFDNALMLADKYRPGIELACFHCHQSVEKILKAYIIAKGMPFFKTHDLSFLRNQCETHEPDFDTYGPICNALKAYASAGRYPQTIDLTEYHMRQAIKDAQQVLEFTKSKLKEMGYEYDPDKDVRVVAASRPET